MTNRALIVATIITIAIILLAGTDYTTGTTLDTQLFPHSKYWSLQTATGRNVITITTYNPSVWYIGVGDRLTVSYIDNM